MDQVYYLMLPNGSVGDLSMRKIRICEKKYNKETLSLLKPPIEDHYKYKNPSTFACCPNNHNVRIEEWSDQNILGNDEDLVYVNIKVVMNFLNMWRTYNRNINTVINDICVSTIALTISNDNLDPESKSIVECQKHLDKIR